jgi:RNA polymerase sigma-70 factor (ECF subfamily)
VIPPDANQQTDSELAHEALKGDREALEALLTRLAPVALRTAYGLLLDANDAQDAAQEALLQVTASLKTWQGGNLRGWIAASAHGKAVSLIRSRQKARAREVQAMEGRDGAAADAASLLASEETMALLRDVWAELPDETGRLLARFHLEGASAKDLAQDLGISQDACWQRLHRAREELAERLRAHGLKGIGAALLLALLTGLGQQAQAWEASLPPETKTSLVQHALERAALDPVPASLAPQPANGVQSMPLALLHGVWMIMTRNPVLTLAALLLLAVGISWLNQSGWSADQPGPNPAPPEPPVTAIEAGPPDWQAPRYLNLGTLIPVDVTARGPHALVLCADHTTPEKPALVLLESLDAGRSWQRTATLPGYRSGSVALSATGGIGILARGISPKLEKLLQGEEDHANNPMLQEGNLLDTLAWFHRSAGGTFAESAVAAKNHALYSASKVVATPDGFWCFAYAMPAQPMLALLEKARKAESGAADSDPRLPLAAIKELNSPSVLTGFADAGCAPAWNETHLTGRMNLQIIAWALDRQRAGVVLTLGQPGKIPGAWDLGAETLNHFATSDGGKTWANTEIRFVLSGGSTDAKFQVTPAALARDGERLGLVVTAMKVPAFLEQLQKMAEQMLFKGEGEPADLPDQAALAEKMKELFANEDAANKMLSVVSNEMTMQNYLLESSDLGKTWQLGEPVSPEQSLTSGMDAQQHLHLAGGQMYISYTRVKVSGLGGKGLGQAVFQAEQTEETERLFKIIKAQPAGATVLASPNGKKWFDQHICQGFETQILANALGGDAGHLHVASLVCKNPPDNLAAPHTELGECVLVIRSLTPGPLGDAEEGRPEWLKTEPLPVPTPVDEF